MSNRLKRREDKRRKGKLLYQVALYPLLIGEPIKKRRPRVIVSPPYPISGSLADLEYLMCGDDADALKEARKAMGYSSSDVLRYIQREGVC